MPNGNDTVTKGQVIISRDALIPLGLVLTLASAAVSFGVAWQKIDDMDRRLSRVEDKVDLLVQREVPKYSLSADAVSVNGK